MLLFDRLYVINIWSNDFVTLQDHLHLTNEYNVLVNS